MSNFYKIECKEALKDIEYFFDKRDAILAKVVDLCNHFGFKNHRTDDHVVFGIRFINMVADPKKDVIDKNLWKTTKIKGSHLVNVLPRASAKEHKKKYISMLPESMGYEALNEIILTKGADVFFQTYGYRYKKGGYFMFETSLCPSDLAIEILGSEYRGTNN